MDLFALSKLVTFGGEISRRLIAFSERIDEAPSSILSIGYEIRSTCDVLNELHVVLKRQQNERVSSISPNALEELQEAVGKCDEIIYEVARAVLVAHERMKNVPTIDGLLVLSIQERVQWPLFQMRLPALIPRLSSAKMDIVLHLLVQEVRSERFYGEQLNSGIFTSLSEQQREDVISQLWHSQTQNQLNFGTPFSQSIQRSSTTLGGLTEEDTNRGESDTSDVESDQPQKRGRSIFRRLARHLSGSSSRAASNSSARHPQPTEHRPKMASRANTERSLARSPSGSTKSTSDLSAASSAGRSWSSSSSVPTMSSNSSGPQRLRLLSITNPHPITQASKGASSSSWQHGPTMSAKRGIELEWAAVRSKEEENEWEQGTGAEERRLGRQLLLNQLESKAAMQSRNALAPTVTVEMLVSRWTTVPRRDALAGPWQESVAGPSHDKLNNPGEYHRPAQPRRAETAPSRNQLAMGLPRQVTC